ncbi:ABC transporter substrate-binding protein [Vibrio sp. S17_S38]|uniref:helical backbone metal receptor n=1 Tax=Vibrio sp. S17_S38 TaxID=2720229 RepID=UPI0016801295|nr:helical backbone metal receptor [Vibrio sp. S17_S38]MBD1572781.1 ABC transporter substrate-binding protein [Vibrio sp. S17_S38]
MSAFRALLIFCLLTLFSPYNFANNVAQRVITLTPHATELAFSAGLGDKIIAVSEMSDYPQQASTLEKIANYQGIKLERILALKPDLVIAWSKNSSPREVDQLKRFGIPVYYSSISTLEDIADNLDALSQWAEDPSIGKSNAKIFREQLSTIRLANQKKKSIFYFHQLSEVPIITVSDPYWPSAIFNICNGKNVFANSPAPYPQVGKEQVIAENPEVIFTSNHINTTTELWQKWSQIPAVKHKLIFNLNPDWLNRPTMRSLQAIKQVCADFDLARKSNKLLH